MYLSAAYEYQHLYIAQQVGLCSNVPIMPIKTIAENSGMTVRKPTPSKTDRRSGSEIRDLQILLRFYWLRGVILKKPRAWISDVLAGKLDSHHSTTAFSENVVVTETSYQMEEILSFCDRRWEGFNSFNKITMFFFWWTKLSWVSIFGKIWRKTLSRMSFSCCPLPSIWRS